jgi:TP901 family phage tail tape measure protein
MAQQKLGIEITGNAQGLTNAISTAEGKLKAFGSKLQSVGGSLTRSLTLPLVAIGGAATSMALNFDQSMTQIKSLVGIAGDEVDAMGETAKQMALDTGKSATEAGDALFFITSAGLRGDEAMQTLEASLKAAAVGLGETKTIADLATSAMNAYGSDTLSASAATDILATSVREGKLEASQLAGSMGGVIPIASNLGVEFHEVAGAMAAMSRTGTNASEGATQLNAILSSIAKPTEQSIDAFKRMGLTADDLQKSLSEDGLMTTLVLLKNRIDANGMSFTDIVPNIRAWKGVLDLTGAGMETNIGIMKSLENHLGATDRMFKITAESASFKFNKSLNEMKGSLHEVGLVLLNMLVPVVTKLGNFLREASDSFKNLDDGTKRFIITIGGVVAVVGPALIVIGKISNTLGFLSKSLPLLTTNWKLFSAALMANPIIAVATAVLALGTAIYAYTQSQKDALAEVNTMDEVETALAEKRKKFLEESAKLADGYGGKTRENVRLLQDEIRALEDKKRALEAIATSSAQGGDTPMEQTATSANTTRRAVESVTSSLIALGAVQLTNPLGGTADAIVADLEKINTATKVTLSDSMIRAQVFTQGVSDIITGGLNDLAVGIGEALGNALANGGSLAGALAETMLSTIGKMAVELGKLAIGIGIGLQSIQAALKTLNPVVAIAAGVALVALGSFLKSRAAGIAGGGGAGSMPGGGAPTIGGIPAFANGGIVSGPTLGLMGEYPGARSNPEVIAPLNKLQSLIGGNRAQNVNVGGEFVMRGSDLVVVLDRANKNRNRLI